MTNNSSKLLATFTVLLVRELIQLNLLNSTRSRKLTLHLMVTTVFYLEQGLVSVMPFLAFSGVKLLTNIAENGFYLWLVLVGV